MGDARSESSVAPTGFEPVFRHDYGFTNADTTSWTAHVLAMVRDSNMPCVSIDRSHVYSPRPKIGLNPSPRRGQDWSEADILRHYPGLTHDDIAACLLYA